jgi:hypothetical protein
LAFEGRYQHTAVKEGSDWRLRHYLSPRRSAISRSSSRRFSSLPPPAT